MEKYLFVSDLDGTLLNKKRKIPKTSIRYIKKLVKNGHYFIIATGRPYQGCINYYKQLKLNFPLVCNNGSAIHFPNNHLLDIYISIPLDLFLNLIKEIKEYILAAFSPMYDVVYFQNRKKVPLFMQHLDESRTVIEGDFEKILKHSPINPNLFIKQENIQSVLDILNQEKYKNIINYRYWGNWDDYASLELFHKDATKGNALLRLKEMFNISDGNDFSFGDSLNDLDLIGKASNGVAMKNGKEELKKAAKYITTKPNYKNGEIHFIKLFFKNKKHL